MAEDLTWTGRRLRRREPWRKSFRRTPLLLGADVSSVPCHLVSPVADWSRRVQVARTTRYMHVYRIHILLLANYLWTTSYRDTLESSAARDVEQSDKS